MATHNRTYTLLFSEKHIEFNVNQLVISCSNQKHHTLIEPKISDKQLKLDKFSFNFEKILISDIIEVKEKKLKILL